MAESTYKTLTEKLDKLQRNESQMTEQQKTEYAAQLKALRHKISSMAGEIAREFILGGTQIKRGEDASECARQIQAIVQADQARAEYKAAIEVLFRTYDIAKFTAALIPIHNRVRYEGYAPYWCKHCTPYTGTSYSGKPLTFWNDIIGMGWNEKTGIWYREDESRISLSLPPTTEKVKEKYEAEVQMWITKTAPALWTANGG